MLLRTAFASVSYVTSCLYAAPSMLKTAESAALSHFSPISTNTALKLALYECPRAAVLPPARVRRARVEDHDDLLPVLDSAAARFPHLTSLPEWTRPEESFGLARLISAQDEQHVVLVAEVGKKLVGFMALSTHVDGPRLQVRGGRGGGPGITGTGAAPA